MNLFILSLFHREIAECMMDKHISKIILEAVQMLSSAKRILDPEDPINDELYKTTHKNHPVSVWVRASQENYIWVLDLVEEMHTEWKWRYAHPADKFHKSYLVALKLREYAPTADKFETSGLTPFALAMPDEYKTDDAIQSYRNYYLSPEKRAIATWKRRSAPEWYV
jgi:hypothetical protein